jgi:hypothetical protein
MHPVESATCRFHGFKDETVKWLEFVCESGGNEPQVDSKVVCMLPHDVLTMDRVTVQDKPYRSTIVMDATWPVELLSERLCYLPP